MDPAAAARREIALEIRELAAEFGRSDEAAFRRSRIICWIVTAAVTVVILLLLVTGADWRYLGCVWAAVVGLTWAGHAYSDHRQRQQTGRLGNLATRWLAGDPPPTAG